MSLQPLPAPLPPIEKHHEVGQALKSNGVVCLPLNLYVSIMPRHQDIPWISLHQPVFSNPLTALE